MNADETLHSSNEFILKAEEKSVLHGFFSLLYRIDQRRSNAICTSRDSNREEKVDPHTLDNNILKKQNKNSRSKKQNGT